MAKVAAILLTPSFPPIWPARVGVTSKGIKGLKLQSLILSPFYRDKSCYCCYELEVPCDYQTCDQGRGRCYPAKTELAVAAQPVPVGWVRDGWCDRSELSRDWKHHGIIAVSVSPYSSHFLVLVPPKNAPLRKFHPNPLKIKISS